jgi:glycine/D-amino acid oxidase-like deaminating enzyme
MLPRFDAIIIGGGHNGLVTAAYLARAGRIGKINGLLAPPQPHLPSAPRPPAGAAHNKAERGVAHLGLARRRRLGERSAAGVPWGDGGLGKPMANGMATLSSVRHPVTARTAPTRPRTPA